MTLTPAQRRHVITLYKLGFPEKALKLLLQYDPNLQIPGASGRGYWFFKLGVAFWWIEHGAGPAITSTERLMQIWIHRQEIV